MRPTVEAIPQWSYGTGRLPPCNHSPFHKRPNAPPAPRRRVTDESPHSLKPTESSFCHEAAGVAIEVRMIFDARETRPYWGPTGARAVRDMLRSAGQRCGQDALDLLELLFYDRSPDIGTIAEVGHAHGDAT